MLSSLFDPNEKNTAEVGFDDEIKYRISVFVPVMLAGGVFLILFGINNLVGGYYFNGLFDLIVGLLIVVCLLIMNKVEKSSFILYIITQVSHLNQRVMI